MWRDTLDMIRAQPLAGVGAGSWEIQMPRYQKGAAVELDYFAHNEYLQLVAEYGVVGWIFLALLLAALARSAWALWHARGLRSAADGPARAFALASLLGLLLVSLTGFPARHMAATGALLGVCLGLVAATHAPVVAPAGSLAGRIRIPGFAGAGVAALGLVLCAWVSTQAMRAEWTINAAAQLARGVTATGDPRNAQLASVRAEAVRLILEGTALNPHNRRIAAPVGDELARWGDWKNATEVWERTATSRPYVVVILTNVARGYLRTGQPEKARVFVDRAREVQPQGNYVRALDVLVTGQGGDEARALTLARSALGDGVTDYDLFNYVHTLATKAGDHGLAARAMAARLKQWPREEPATAWLQLAEARQRQGEADAGARRLPGRPGPGHAGAAPDRGRKGACRVALQAWAIIPRFAGIPQRPDPFVVGDPLAGCHRSSSGTLEF